MKKAFFFQVILLLSAYTYAQSNAVMTAKMGANTNELQTVLYFEEIGYEKFSVKSAELKGKNYQIIIKEFKDGKVFLSDTVFNSKEDEYFRIKEDSLSFAVLTKASDINEFKIQFQFNGFSFSRKYKILAKEKNEFVLKDFLGAKSEIPINLTGSNDILAYMMPYVKADKSKTYCEVAQSGTDPEKLYETYKIPHYFLVKLRFE